MGTVKTVVIADDHRLMLEAVRVTLEATEDIRVAGQAESGAQVLPVVRRTAPDVLLLDLHMPGMDGFACLERVRKEAPSVNVIVFSAFEDAESVARALRGGAIAFLSKRIDPRDLPSALRLALDRTVYRSLGAPEWTPETTAREMGLSERELEMLRALARGLSNDQIARDAWVAPQTVKFHLSNIYRKLNVRNRTEAAKIAYESGLCEQAAAPAASQLA